MVSVPSEGAVEAHAGSSLACGFVVSVPRLALDGVGIQSNTPSDVLFHPTQSFPASHPLAGGPAKRIQDESPAQESGIWHGPPNLGYQPQVISLSPCSDSIKLLLSPSGEGAEERSPQTRFDQIPGGRRGLPGGFDSMIQSAGHDGSATTRTGAPCVQKASISARLSQVATVLCLVIAGLSSSGAFAGPYTPQYPNCSCTRSGTPTIPYTIVTGDTAVTGGALLDWGYADFNPARPGGALTQNPSSPLANPRNSACDLVDGAGDPDSAAINSDGRDLVWFAYTWDNTNLAMFTKRAGTSSAQQFFIYFADIDSDELMETTDRIIVAEWKSGGVTTSIWTYNPATPGGDPMTNVSGDADGYTMPGTWGTNLGAAGTGTQGPLADAMEVLIPWSALTGGGVPTGVTFHITTLSGSGPSSGGAISSNAQDNMGGCGGKLGGTSYSGLNMYTGLTSTADTTTATTHSFYAEQGATTAVLHRLVFTGWGTDSYDLASTLDATGGIGTSPTLTFYLDDGDGVFEPGAGDGSPITRVTFTNTSSPPTAQASDTAFVWAAHAVAQTNAWSPRGTFVFTDTATSTLEPDITARTVVDTLTVDLLKDSNNDALNTSLLKTSVVHTDPVNCTTPLDAGTCGANPKRVPGSVVTNTVTLYNNDGYDATNLRLMQTIDADADVVITNPTYSADTNGRRTVQMTDSNTDQGDAPTAPQPCGFTSVTVSYATRATPTVFTATPAPAGTANTDANIGAIRIELGGTLKGARANSPNVPTCSFQYRVQVK